jgi:tetratricopeptide (TPR) repeat protein
MSKTAHELTRKEMKGPDRFQQVAADAAGWMAKRQKQVVLAVLGALVVVAIVIGISSWFESRGKTAGADLYRALDVASGEVSSIPLPGFTSPIYKTAEEKEKALLAEAQRVRERHGGSRAATTAALLEADAQFRLGDFDKAIAAYQAYLAAVSADDSLRFAGLDGLARAQERKGDLAAAAGTWEKAGAIDFFKDRATLERARVLAKSGKPDEARKALEGVAKDSPLFGEAQERLTRIGGK